MLEVCPSRLTRCLICKSPILPDTIRVSKHRMYSSTLYYHLACWRPDPVIPLSLSSLCTWKIKDKEQLKEVEKWVEQWNYQFEHREELIPAQYLGKAVSTSGTPLRRLLLAVFQYCTMAEVESQVAYTCKAWFHISRDQEYWRTRFVADYHPSETEAQGDYRRKYIVYLQGSCWHCCKLLEIAEVHFQCSYFKRPLCNVCVDLPECAVVSFNEYASSHQVTSATLAHLSVPSFLFHKAKSSYMLLFQRCVLPYSATRLKQLLEIIDSDYVGRLRTAERSLVESFDLGKYYGDRYQRVTGIGQALMKHCGKRSKSGNRKGEVETFLVAVEKARPTS